MTRDTTPAGVIEGGWTDGWRRPLVEGRATPEGTAAFHARFPRVPGRVRPYPLAAPTDGSDAAALSLSSVGIGTYLGAETDADDALYLEATRRALALGVNVLDTAVSYRAQRSERLFGRALAEAFAAGTLRREEVFVASKAGYVPYEGARPREGWAFVEERFVRSGLATSEEIVNGVHCIAPRYLDDQIERSRRNLGLATIDLYYLHNPESHLDGTSRETFFARLLPAFVALEQAVRDGRIGAYGTATWHGYRKPPGQHVHHPLHQFLDVAQRAAREVGAAAHHFRVVQLPYNLAMPEAYAAPTQQLGADRPDERVPLLQAAARAGLYVMTSAPLLQGQLTDRLPAHVREALDEGTEAARVRFDDPQRALQFARSTPGVGTALAGMKRPEHVEANLRVLAVPALAEATITRLFREDD